MPFEAASSFQLQVTLVLHVTILKRFVTGLTCGVQTVSKELWITKPPLKPTLYKEHCTHCFCQSRVQCQRVWNVKNVVDFVYHLAHPGLWVWTRVHFCPLCLLPIRCQERPLNCKRPLNIVVSKVFLRWDPFWSKSLFERATTMCTGSELNVRSLSLCLGFKPVLLADYVHVENEWWMWQTRFDPTRTPFQLMVPRPCAWKVNEKHTF